MSAVPAPLMTPPIRPAVTSLNNRGGARNPRLALSIPGTAPAAPATAPLNPGRPGLPQLRLATPSGAPGAATDSTNGFTSSSSGQSIASQYSALGHALGLKAQVRGSPENGSTGTTSTDGEKNGRNNSDVDQSTLDVEDLDDEGWKIAREQDRIIELGSLGEGAGGAVTKCRLKGGKTTFAMKIITTDPSPEVKKQIVRELNFNKECSSSHICKYYGAFIDVQSATISIAMEFCEGGSLDSVYREVKKLGGRTGEKVLGKIAEGVLEGLTYLSGRKIIHRDIKPSNILLCKNGQVKLCDFGVSGELIGSKGDANTFIGTSYYMAPERIQGLSYTITSDVWSLGVTLMEVAQNRFPFLDDNGSGGQAPAMLIELLTFIVRKPIPELKDEPGIKWSPNFKYFLACCLEKDTARRASPWRMLEHPWIVEMKNKKVNMANFLAQVWDWK
ncbi:kinase-like domain-containing protein [Peziza echinospora]|nr:kinase-like domain-containing protein [Peziza echinospora]